MMMRQGFFITLEGGEGVGKSTHLAFLKEYFTTKNIPVYVTREPGGSRLGEALRQVLLSNELGPITPDAELLLMFAARIEHVRTVIMPALAKGVTVISDRYVDASYAYQGGGRGIDFSRIAMVEAWSHLLSPHLTFLLDAPLEITQARMTERGRTLDRIEQEKIEFFESVQKAYHKRAQKDPARIKLIDASRSIPEIQEQLVGFLEKQYGLV